MWGLVSVVGKLLSGPLPSYPPIQLGLAGAWQWWLGWLGCYPRGPAGTCRDPGSQGGGGSIDLVVVDGRRCFPTITMAARAVMWRWTWFRCGRHLARPPGWVLVGGGWRGLGETLGQQ
jgi:hypothetical protein